MTTSTRAGNVSGDEPKVLVPYVSLEDAPDWVSEGTTITPSEPESTQVEIATGAVKVLIGVSREQWSTGQAATLLSDAVRSAMIRKANRLYLSQIAPRRTHHRQVSPRRV